MTLIFNRKIESEEEDTFIESSEDTGTGVVTVTMRARIAEDNPMHATVEATFSRDDWHEFIGKEPDGLRSA